jgi:hypothetical protein
MLKIIEYRTIVVHHGGFPLQWFDKLDVKVNEFIKQGYQPLGCVTSNDHDFMQTMIKYEELVEPEEIDHERRIRIKP